MSELNVLTVQKIPLDNVDRLLVISSNEEVKVLDKSAIATDLSNYYTKDQVDTAIDGVDDRLTAVEDDVLVLSSEIEDAATQEWVEDQGYITDISGKQDVLVSGENIKTINSQSLLGSGDISIDDIPSIVLRPGDNGEMLYFDATAFEKVRVAVLNRRPAAIAMMYQSAYYVIPTFVVAGTSSLTVSMNWTNPGGDVVAKHYIINANGTYTIQDESFSLPATVDATVTETSTNPVQSKGVFDYLNRPYIVQEAINAGYVFFYNSNDGSGWGTYLQLCEGGILAMDGVGQGTSLYEITSLYYTDPETNVTKWYYVTGSASLSVIGDSVTLLESNNEVSSNVYVDENAIGGAYGIILDPATRVVTLVADPSSYTRITQGETYYNPRYNLVTWNQIEGSGTKIAEIIVDGQTTDVYAPTSGGGGGGGSLPANITGDSGSFSQYVMAPAFVGEGDNTTYYHRLDFGGNGTNQWGFYDYGGDYTDSVTGTYNGKLGEYNFFRNQSANQSSRQLIGAIRMGSSSASPDGWVGNVLADKVVINNGTSTQLLAADGSLYDIQSLLNRIAQLEAQINNT